MKKTLIFSDVHLKVTDAARPHQQEFVNFLRAIDPAEFDRVICLGDLFDFWFEYRHVIFSGCFEVLRAFADLRDAGIELHIVCGNHDFWAGRFLQKVLGFHVYADPVVLPFGSRQVHLAHGDGVNPKDRRYRLYRRFARHPWVVGAFRLIHPDWAMAIAQGVSHSSRTLLQVANPAHGPEARAISEYAQRILAQGGVDAVLCGHAHAPIRQEHPTPSGKGTYINTGDWFVHRTHLVWDGADFHQIGLENHSSPCQGE